MKYPQHPIVNPTGYFDIATYHKFGETWSFTWEWYVMLKLKVVFLLAGWGWFMGFNGAAYCNRYVNGVGWDWAMVMKCNHTCSEYYMDSVKSGIGLIRLMYVHRKSEIRTLNIYNDNIPLCSICSVAMRRDQQSDPNSSWCFNRLTIVTENYWSHS